jgi:hypothetical protein
MLTSLVMALTLAGQVNLATITGGVEDPTGVVIPSVQAELRSETNPEIVLRGMSDEHGVYVFDGVRAGNYTLRLSGRGFNHVTWKSIYIPEGEHISLPALQLAPAYSGCDGRPMLDYFRTLKSPSGSGDLGGSVRVDTEPMTGRESPPIGGAEVVLLCGSRPCRTTTSDALGQFLFEKVPAGDYAIRVSHAGFYTETVSGYSAQPERQAFYFPIYLQHCGQANCNPAKRPKKQLVVCE